MKTLTQVILPIAILVGIVFGITYIINYTPPDSKNKDKPQVAVTESLKFPMTSVQSDPNDWKMRYWNSQYEVGKTGEFWYWFRNVNDQPVRFVSTGVSCKCAGVEVSVIPQDAMNQYLINRASAHIPGVLASPIPILDIASLIRLNEHIHWQPLPEKADVGIPGAPVSADEQSRNAHLNRENPQFAIVKLKWESKAQTDNKDAADSVTGHFTTQLPNANPAAMNLEAKFMVVQPLNLHVPSTGKPHEVRLGTMQAGTILTNEVICWSKTRTELPLTFELLTAGTYKQCVTWSEPQRLSEREIADLERNLQVPDQPPIKIRSAYRALLTVYEQREVEHEGKKTLRQLDLGPLNFQVNVSAGATPAAPATKPVPLYVFGVVRGDVRIFNGGESSDAIDFGSSFTGNQDETRRVTIVSQRAGLQLELNKEECLPETLQVKLHQPEEKDGAKQWTLEVTIPAKSLFGDLPSSSRVILMTNDPIPRRIRIPVKAKQLE
jgi:hypothetical protein